MQVLSDYPCTVRYRSTVPYRTVRYGTVHYSICQVDFPYGTVQYLFCFMRPVVLFHYYPWNNQVFFYGTVQYIIVLYRTVDLIHFSRLLIHYSLKMRFLRDLVRISRFRCL